MWSKTSNLTVRFVLMASVMLVSSESAFLAGTSATDAAPPREKGAAHHPAESDDDDQDDDDAPQMRVEFYDGFVRVPRPPAPERTFLKSPPLLTPSVHTMGLALHRADSLVLASCVRTTAHAVTAAPIRPHAPPR